MSAMLSLFGYNCDFPTLKGLLMLKSANHLPFSNAQKQCLVKISFNLKLPIGKSSLERKSNAHLLLETKGVKHGFL